MKILEEIKQHKLAEIQEKKRIFPVSDLEKSEWFKKEIHSMKRRLEDPNQSGIIAEFKRKSPSKGFINQNALVEEVTPGYVQAGVSALSVLTNEAYFGAQKDDFEKARNLNACPILRKEFIVDEYQIVESKSMGADVLLLIAKMLSPDQISSFSEMAKNLGMEVLVEFHEEKEIETNAKAVYDFAGINNRNLNSFEVDIENSLKLAALLPSKTLKIAESGIESVETLKAFKQNGFQGFLIGEYFMRGPNPALRCSAFIEELKNEA